MTKITAGIAPGLSGSKQPQQADAATTQCSRVQSKMMQQLKASGMLTNAEQAILRWCTNAKWHHPSRKGLSRADYIQASALEAFVRPVL